MAPARPLRTVLGAFCALSLCLAGTVWAQSPATPPPSPALQDAATSGEPAEPIAAEEVIAVPPWLDALVRERVIEPTSSREERLKRLVELLFGADGLALEYDGGRTRTITQSAEDRKANCLSFALMFATLARRAGIDADVRETDFVLAWQDNGALYGNGHVNVGVTIRAQRKIVDIDQSVISTRGKPRVISDQRVLSHYYNNRGAELMAAGQLQEARLHLTRAIELTPDFTAAWNNLGVLATREDALMQAEQAYRRALDIDARHSPSLSNLVNLYRRLGDAKRQAEFEKRLFRVQRKDPFHQILVAMGYEQAGDYAAAAEHYRRAIRLKAKDDFVYFGLARAYARLGDTRRAIDALVHARDAAGEDRDLYQTKLDRLRRLHPALVR
jgi:tetratricopeptide (TPR) repeat protein